MLDYAAGDRRRAEVDIVGLVSTIKVGSGRHARVRRELLLRQAGAVGPPVHEVTIPWPCRNEEYEAAMSAVVAAARDQGVSRMAFGERFLADIRAYRQEMLRGIGLEPMFPLWGRDTARPARDMLDAGIAAISCVDTSQLAPASGGRCRFRSDRISTATASCSPTCCPARAGTSRASGAQVHTGLRLDSVLPDEFRPARPSALRPA